MSTKKKAKRAKTKPTRSLKTETPAPKKVGGKGALLAAAGAAAVLALAAFFLWPKDPPQSDEPQPARSSAQSALQRKALDETQQNVPTSAPTPAPVPMAPLPDPASLLVDGNSPQETVEGLKEEALRLAESLIAEFGETPETIVFIGNVHLVSGSKIKAEEYWKQGLKLDPNRADVFLGMGRLFLRKGKYEESIEEFRKAATMNPRLLEAWDSMALAHMNLGRPREAIEALAKSLEIEPNAAKTYFLLGQQYQALEQYEKAKEYYAKAVALNPYLTSAHYGLTTACMKLGQREEAKQHRARLMDLKTKEMVLFKDRLNAYDDVQKQRDSLAEIYCDAANFYRKAGKMAAAEALWKNATAYAPKNVDCRKDLASFYYDRERFEDALKHYADLWELEPGNLIHALNVGLIHKRVGRFAEAEKVFREAIEAAPEDSSGYRELTRLYLATNHNLPEALRFARKAMELDPEAMNSDVLSWALDLNGDIDGAIQAMTDAIRLDPTNQQYRRKHNLLEMKKKGE